MKGIKKMSNYENILETAKQEILADIANGVVPASVQSFDDLQDYVDANAYGNYLGWNISKVWDANIYLANAVVDALTAWLKEGAK